MLNNCLINKNASVKEAIEVIENNNLKSVFIVDENMILLGIFTRGDLKQFLLKNGDIHDSISKVMNKAPITFKSKREAQVYSQNQRRIVYPIVDNNRKLIDVLENSYDIYSNAISSNCLKDIPVVIMAGGLGTRLYPLTKVLPKGLVPIGDETIMEKIIKNFNAWGCNDYYFVLNHKAEMIKAYFDSLEKTYNIHYIKEEAFLGTGGGLSLLKGKICNTFVLTNCDILVNADFDCVLKQHRDDNNIMTLIGALRNSEIPYGVLDVNEKGVLSAFKEKPELSYIVNTGVYMIEPEVINNIPKDHFCHITDIIQDGLRNNKRIGVFPITEKSWMDMGQFDELDRMRRALGIES